MNSFSRRGRRRLKRVVEYGQRHGLTDGISEELRVDRQIKKKVMKRHGWTFDKRRDLWESDIYD